MNKKKHVESLFFRVNFQDLGLITNCAIIELTKGEIDTVINVTNENIMEIHFDHYPG